MPDTDDSLLADSSTIWAWLAARSIARGLPLPVPEHGGMRVDTASPQETRRYVFAAPSAAIVALAASIRAPRIPIKLCGPGERLLALAPPGWSLLAPSWFMTQGQDGPMDAALPAGYRIETTREGRASSARVLAADGTLAASGHAAEHGGAFVFDRIQTEAAHRRRGLGRALMAALGALQQDPASRRLLVATEEGRALYATLGWRVLSPYSTIVIPG